jgi:peptidyl-dipeptidase Dcp
MLAQLKLKSFFVAAILLSACSENPAEQTPQPSGPDSSNIMSNQSQQNPLLVPSSLPFEYPVFDQIRAEHYLPAFEQGMAEHLAEINAIADQAAAPSFDNTLVPLEQSGRVLDRVSRVFFSMTSAHTSDALNAIESEIAPQLSAHYDQINLNAALFNRIDSLYQQRETLALDPEQQHLLEETRKGFILAGAQLNEDDKARLREINGELAELGTRFSQNVLNEVNAVALVVDSEAELAGLNAAQIQAASDEANSRGLAGKYVLPLLNTSGQPLLSSLQNRNLRQRIYETSLSRGHRGGDYDNREILSRTARLRAEKAQLLGFDNYADYSLQTQTAPSVDAVNQQLAQLSVPALRNARQEALDLQAIIDAEGGDFELAAWDWAYYAEKVRQQRYQFDESQLRPYFEVNNVLQNGVFYAASQLFGITFTERHDLPVYQDDVRVFEVFAEDGSTLSYFILDLYARPSKSGGAWMNAYVSQSHLLGTHPVVANHHNIPEPPPGEPTLLTFDEVNTLFHEFGHALHGMFSDVTYPSFAGTSVPRDFVEFPSQVNEMWADWPEVLANYARHYESGEALPQVLLERVLDAMKFNQGYASTEYLAASVTDMALHQLNPDEVPEALEIMQFEQEALAAAGFDLEVVPPRYRLTYFSHIMGGYAAGYYSYIWSEVLDADAVEWFRENGGLLRQNGQHFRDTLLSRGGSVEAMQLYENFRGRAAEVAPLLERRGLN